MFGIRRKDISSLTDEELMQRSSKGDRLAFENIYERYFDKLVWFARRYVFEHEKAEDVVQEVFMKLIRKPESFDNGRRFSTWIYTVTSNACRNELRKAGREAFSLEEEQVSSLSTQAKEPDYIKQEIRSVFKQLNDKEKQVFVLRFELEMSIREIAEIIDIPEGSVKSCLFYLLKKFAKQLKHYQYER